MKNGLWLGTVVASLVLCACPKPGTGPGHARRVDLEKYGIVKDRTEALEAAAKKREERHTKLKAMNVAGLAAELAVDSTKEREPFNSSAFAETVRRGEAAAQELVPAITPDRKSLLALLALRRSRAAYDRIPPNVRAAILVDALRNSRYFNTWGMPHLKWEEAAQAIIDERANQVIVRPLSELLRDTRSAPVWGGEYHGEYLRYRYRVCDYAWALLAAIRNEKIEIPADPAQRDVLIRRMGAAPPP